MNNEIYIVWYVNAGIQVVIEMLGDSDCYKGQTALGLAAQMAITSSHQLQWNPFQLKSPCDCDVFALRHQTKQVFLS